MPPSANAGQGGVGPALSAIAPAHVSAEHVQRD